MIGKKVGNSVVAAVANTVRMPSGGIRYSYKLLCMCGNEFVLSRGAIGGALEPCPSCRKKNAGPNATDHPLYKTWQTMISRCYQPTCSSYKTYGARGITVCDAWIGTKRKLSGGDGFLAFLRDVGDRPSSMHTLDRIDNNRGYYPDNVRWATPLQQAKNRSTTKLVTIGDKTQSFSAWLRELGVASSVAFRRMKKTNINHEQFVQTVIELRKD
jgi:hypothetical protein